MRIAICGYGNLGKGVEAAAARCADCETVGVFTRRNPGSLKPVLPGTRIFPAAELPRMREEIDVIVNCGGSVQDLPRTTPELAQYANIVDSFDTHARARTHFERTDAMAKRGLKTAVIGAGWDPGLFSLARLYFKACLPGAEPLTFWGPGISQGHSDALRRLDGVLDARQYTIPDTISMSDARRGRLAAGDPHDLHRRVCYIAVKPGTDREALAHTIRQMPDYFEGYQTDIYYLSEETLHIQHPALPHGGSVIACVRTGAEDKNRQCAELKLSLDSNPEFTAGILIAYARAAVRMNGEGRFGCLTPADIPPAYLLPAGENPLLTCY